MTRTHQLDSHVMVACRTDPELAAAYQ